ncbi:MAG: hypothetical protein M1829_001864 [Trizodia sp. TS-e1964]|nr:MAG: hypothetical protein M1829_001864 [Trizodia sp. TS-e1964]
MDVQQRDHGSLFLPWDTPKLHDAASIARLSRASVASNKTSASWSSMEQSQYSPTWSQSGRGSSGRSSYSRSSNQSSIAPSLSPYQNKPLMRPVKTRRPFHSLPQEIYDCIMKQLKILHSDPLSPSCATCYLRDLHSIALTSKTFCRAVTPHLYDSIWLVGSDSSSHIRKRFKIKYGARLKLLRRSLRDSSALAQYVRDLKVPEPADYSNKAERAKFIDIVASIIMACPNLECLVGFYPTYSHEFDRLRYALSTRAKLREHVWVITGKETAPTRSSPTTYFQPGILQPEETEMFLRYHDRWSSLRTLFLHSQNTGVLEHELFVGVFSRLPSLEHLAISNFAADDFDDETLMALPSLRSLRLEDLHGVTDNGISRFARTPASKHLRALSLINLEIMALGVVSKLLSSLRQLNRFTLVQKSSPELPLGGWVMQPIVASTSLSYLHWDILIPGNANDNLASSIMAGGFPSLRTIRAPSDHHGVLQAVCRPRESITLASDKYSYSLKYAATNRDRYLRTLYAARKAAQERIEEARTRIRFKVIVEEDGVVQQVFPINGYMGLVGSIIDYTLTPDVFGSDNAVIDILDLVDGTKETQVKDGCTGLWNSHHPAGKKWWSHTERYRYTPVQLSRYF